MGPIVLLSAGMGMAQAWSVNTNQHGVQLSWPEEQVGWSLNSNGEHALAADALQGAMEEAAGQWNDVEDSDLELTYLGPTTHAATDYTDGQNIIYFEEDWELDPALLAVTYVWSLEDGSIIAFDMAVNTADHDWTTVGDTDANDLHNTVTHEFGHALGLAHSEISDASMYESTFAGETAKRDIEVDDEHGLRFLYGNTVYEPEAAASSGGGCSVVGVGGSLWAGLALLPAVLVRRRD